MDEDQIEDRPFTLTITDQDRSESDIDLDACAQRAMAHWVDIREKNRDLDPTSFWVGYCAARSDMASDRLKAALGIVRQNANGEPE